MEWHVSKLETNKMRTHNCDNGQYDKKLFNHISIIIQSWLKEVAYSAGIREYAVSPKQIRQTW